MAQSPLDGTFQVSAWGATKFVETSNTALTSPAIENRLSQRVLFVQEEISVGSVLIYLGSLISDPQAAFTVHVQVRESDADGIPQSAVLGSATLASSDLGADGWYEFEFGIAERETPDTGLCFVMWQEGGDENNYVSWAYNVGDAYSDARVSSDGTTWEIQENALRTIRISSAFDAYQRIINDDPSKITHQLVTPGASEAFGVQDTKAELAEGEFDNTVLLEREIPYYSGDPTLIPYVRLQSVPLHVSFIVDSSGSAGWNDRFGLRQRIAREVIARLQGSYPNPVTFDFVQFGGRLLEVLGANINQRVRGVFVDVDSVSRITGYDADGNLLEAADVRSHMASGVAAYGFKNLKAGTTYVNYGFDLGWEDVRFRVVGQQWHDIWTSGSPSLSLDSNGPNDETTLNIQVSDSGKDGVRYFYGNADSMARTALASDVSAGDDTLDVSDASVFSNGQFVSVADISAWTPGPRLASVDETSNTLQIGTAVPQPFSVSEGGFVELHAPQSADEDWGQTEGFEFFFLDAAQKGNVTFYVQCLNGAHIEWDFTPLSEWELVSLYFLDETATFEVDAVDANEEPLPDGTLVEWYVDKEPLEVIEEEEEEKQDEFLLVRDALAGTTKLYLDEEDAAKISREDTLDLIDDDRNPEGFAESGEKTYLTSVVSEVDEDAGTITIADELPSDYLLAKNARLLVPSTETDADLDVNLVNRYNVVATLVDITPVYLGEPLPDEYYDVLDPPRADPEAEPDDYNHDWTRVRRNSIEVVMKDGYAAVRLGPVTEDEFTAPVVQEALAKSLFALSDRDEVRLRALQELEYGELKDGEDDTDTDVETEEEEEEETVYFEGEQDFVINHKTYVSNGFADTNMRSFATELVETEIGENNPRTYLAKTYAINPVMTLFDAAGEVLAYILLQNFDVSFAAPIFITNSVNRTVFYRQCPINNEGEGTTYIDREVTGAYATDEDLVTISYEITDKDFPANGTLSVSIYDARRTTSTRMAADDDLSPLNGCGEEHSLAGGENEFSTTETGDEYTASLEDKVLADDILGDGLPSQFELEVLNGIASFTFPKIDRVSLLEVHASYSFDGETKKVVNVQNIYYKNPVVVKMLGMGSKVADGETTSNIGAYVTWKELYPVDDGTIVNFKSGGTPMSPSVSQTVDGIADGVILGPHEPIPAPVTVADYREQEEGGVPETITAMTSFRGYYSEKDGEVEWQSDEAPPGNFYFYAAGENTNPSSKWTDEHLWADGYDYVTINGDLPASSFRAFPFIEKVAPDLLEDRMGVVYSGATPAIRLARWSEEPPVEGPFERDVDVPVGWVSNRMSLNQFIGRPPKREPNPEDPDPCNSPECREISLFTRSRKYGVVGIGIKSDTVSFPSTPSGQPKIPKPRIKPYEPLGITMTVEPQDLAEYQEAAWRKPPLGESPKTSEYDTYSAPAKRNGEAKYRVVAEISWRDAFIVGVPSNPLPQVSFEAGSVEFGEDGSPQFTPLEDPSVFPLDSPTATVTHVRTTADNSHYHEVSLSENGTGVTTKTITYEKGKSMSDHVHKIDVGATQVVSEEVVLDAEGNTFDHGHSLRSVAIVGAGPITDKTAKIAVKAEVTYDNGKLLTDGTRVDRTLDNYAFFTPDDAASETTSGYLLEIIPVGKEYVNGQVVDGFSTRSSGSGRGYTVLYKGSIQLEDGSTIPMPDGTRVFTDFAFYEFNDDDKEKDEGDDIPVVGRDEDEAKTYSVLNIGAHLTEFPDEVSAEKKVAIASRLKWFPDVLTPSSIRNPTSDELTIDGIVASFFELGASQMNDAISTAAKRMIMWRDQIGDAKKIAVLLSDCGESMSQLSFSQAVAQMNSVDRERGVEIFVMKLSETDNYDDLIAQKFALDAGGSAFKIAEITDSADETADDAADAILASENFDINAGTYGNVIDLEATKYMRGLRFSTDVPDGTSLAFKIRFSDDNVTYGQWIELGAGTTFDVFSSASLGRYMQYEIAFRGNYETFESPEFYGVTYEFYEPRGYTLLFQPFGIEEGKDGYVGEILFAHQGTVPDTSTVKYGITHSRSVEFDDYYSVDQPLMDAGTGGIVLSRVNETLIRNTFSEYVAAYGGWNGSYDVAVYRISDESPDGSLVPQDQYEADPKTGKVVFVQTQPISDKFTITLGLKPFFRIGVDMLNRGSDAVVLDYLGTMYRTVDRSEIYAEDDRRQIDTIIETNLLALGISASGTISPSLYVYNTEIGEDSDVLIDIVESGGVYFVLVWNGSAPYVATLAANFTLVETFPISNIGVQPVSMGVMSGIWNISYLLNGRYYVARYDSSFGFIDVVEAGFEDEHSGVVRPRLDRWYIPNGSSVEIFTRSFESRGSISLPSDIKALMWMGEDRIFAVSVYGDVLFEFDLEGAVLAAYSLQSRAVQTFNLSRAADNTFFVEPTRIGVATG